MGAPAPQTLLEAIANAAASGGTPGDKTFPVPDSPTGTNAASIQGGFPAVTMEPETSTGKPPLGQDMNGFLFLITSHTLWVECGQLYTFNSALAAAIGGYLAGTVLGMVDGTGMWLCTASANTNDPDAGGAGWVPIAAYGKASIAVTGGTRVLTAAESKYGVVILTGILANNQLVQFPQTIQEWLVINATSGSFTVTVATAASGSVGVAVPQGGFAAPTGVYSVGDGNLYPTVAPLSIPISQSATSLSIAQRTNTGFLLATYFQMSAGIDNLTAALVMTSTGDGFIRQNTLTDFESQILIQGLGGVLVNGQVPFGVIAQWAATLFASAALTGTPTAPTATSGTSSTQIATTAFANPGVVVNANGVCVNLPSGYKVQMGTANPAGGTVTVTFPVQFTSSVFPVAISIAGGSVQTWLASAPSLASMRLANSGGSSIWIAVGL